MHGVNVKRSVRASCLLFLCGCLFLCGASPAAAQKNKKKKKGASDSASLTLPLPEEQRIDTVISGMLAAWQLGDTERMHQTYADDVSVVSGAWEPPVLGWANYLADYQRQHARVERVRLDRMNTYMRVNGNLAWACYQWEFAGLVDGQPSGARGQTTLLLEKRNGQWLIVHNHTSLIQAVTRSAPGAAPTAAPPPARPENKPPSP